MRLAARGLRDLDTGPQPIAAACERRRVRDQARVVHLASLVTAALLTGLVLLYH